MKKEEERSERVRKALEILSGKPVDKSKARDEIDRFFVAEIIPRLAKLNRAGRLPDLATDPLWVKATELWDSLAEDCSSPTPVEQIKAAMLAAVKSYEERV